MNQKQKLKSVNSKKDKSFYDKSFKLFQEISNEFYKFQKTIKQNYILKAKQQNIIDVNFKSKLFQYLKQITKNHNDILKKIKNQLKINCDIEKYLFNETRNQKSDKKINEFKIGNTTYNIKEKKIKL